MKSIEILATGTMAPLIMDGLNKAFTLHVLPAAPEREAFLSEVGPRIRGVATGGHAKVDGPFLQRLPKVEIVANFGVGYDPVDAACGRRSAASSSPTRRTC